MTTKKFPRVRTMAGLRQQLKRGNNEFCILLGGGGLASSKQIELCKDGSIAVFSGVDGTWNKFKDEKELADWTNIPLAMKRGAFVVDTR